MSYPEKDGNVLPMWNPESLRVLVDDATRKVCRDCKFCRPVSRFDILGWGESRWHSATCNRPSRIEIDIVSGRTEAPYCSCERTSYETIDTCGANAKYFEARS